MRILVTNDDGIGAHGIAVAASLAREVAGPAGEVVTVAPASDRSCNGRAVTFNREVAMRQVGPGRHAVDGTPTDCVILGCELFGQERAFDLVLSGINHGFNLGDDVNVSGTVGAALEGAQRGIPSIALSQGYHGKLDLDDPDQPWRLARARGVEVIRSLHAALRAGLAHCFSVNFPPVPPGEEAGLHLARLGRRDGSAFHARPAGNDDRGHQLYDFGYRTPPPDRIRDADRRLHREGWITVSPLRGDAGATASLTPELAAAIGSHA